MKTLKVLGDRMIAKVIKPVYRTELVPIKDSRGRKVKDDLGRIIKEERDIFIKDVFMSTEFLLDGITFHGKTLTKSGTVAKQRCIIFDRYTGQYFTVAHSLEEISEALSPRRADIKIGLLGHYYEQTNQKKEETNEIY